jgi:MFS family permease
MHGSKSDPARLFGGLSRNVFLLGLVSLFTDLSSQMVFPLLPLFLTSVLGAGAYAVGIVEGAAETTASLLKVVSGLWSDRVRRRKPFILYGYSISSLVKPLFGFAGSWPFVVFVRVMERVGKGVRNAPRDAIVAESCDERVRGKAYGFHRAMDGIGSIAGALAAYLLLPLLGYRRIFWYSLLPGILAVFFILFVSERGADGSEQRTRREKKHEPRFRGIPIPFSLKLFIAASSVFALGHFGYAFMLLRAKNIGLADERAILLYAVFYISYTIFTVPAGMLSDRVGRKPVLGTGYALFAILATCLIAVSSSTGLLVLFIIYGLLYGMIDGVQRAFVVDMAPGGARATALGMFHTAVGLSALPGGYFAGLLWDMIRPEATFVYGVVVTVIALGLLLCVRHENRTAKSGAAP